MTPVVVFLHGIARTRLSMERLRRHVAGAGFRTWACTYPSRRMSVAELGRDVGRRLHRDLPGEELYAVTHSLGGIVARHVDARWKGIVMLAPPNRGSRMAAALADLAAFKELYGPAGLEMASPGDWPVPPAPTAVIAGTKGLSLANPSSWLSTVLGIFEDADHDGTVSVEEARLQGMVDFATVDATHTWIMEHPRTRELVLRFLRSGRLEGEGPG